MGRIEILKRQAIHEANERNLGLLTEQEKDCTAGLDPVEKKALLTIKDAVGGNWDGTDEAAVWEALESLKVYDVTGAISNWSKTNEINGVKTNDPSRAIQSDPEWKAALQKVKGRMARLHKATMCMQQNYKSLYFWLENEMDMTDEQETLDDLWGQIDLSPNYFNRGKGVYR